MLNYLNIYRRSMYMILMFNKMKYWITRANENQHLLRKIRWKHKCKTRWKSII